MNMRLTATITCNGIRMPPVNAMILTGIDGPVGSERHWGPQYTMLLTALRAARAASWTFPQSVPDV